MRTTNKSARTRQRASVIVESAIVLPILMLLLLGTIVVGLGVFRRNQIAYLAREGSRWATVHGPGYSTDQKLPLPTNTDVLTNAVVPRMSGLNTQNLTSTLTWNTGVSPQTVSFTLNYRWVPEAFFSPITFTSTSTQLITY